MALATALLSPQEQRLEDERQGRHQAAGRPRPYAIFNAIKGTKPIIDIERAKYFTASFKTTEGQPLILRWAKALKHIAGNITVYIDDRQLLASRAGCPGRYGLIYPELDGCFLGKVAELTNRVESPFSISEEDLRCIEQEIAPYWQGRTFYEDLARSLPPDVLRVTYDPDEITKSRYIVNETATMRSALQWVHDFEKVLQKGFKAIRQEAEERLAALDLFDPQDALEKAPFLEAVILVADAIVIWAKRHAALAARLAATEVDPQRKAELQALTAICEWVPENPARTFHEAVQAQWFTQMFSRLEQKTGATISNGRMDQYFYPFYRADVEQGRLDAEGAKELLECMWVGMAQYMDLYVSPAGACFNEAYAHWEAVTIGGQDENGEDATNELTYLFLESKREFPINYPDLAARVHARSPGRYLYEIAETVKEGSGFPKLINDEEVIPLLVAKGAAFREANTYAVSGCTEVRMPNRDTYTSPCAYVNIAAALELVLYNGRMKIYGPEFLTLATGELDSLATWEDFWQAYLTQQTYLLKQAFKQQYLVNSLREKHFAAPLGSTLHDQCQKQYKDLHAAQIAGGIDLGYFDIIGYGTVVDSLAAIKKLVYEDRKLSLAELFAALDNNFAGYEATRQLLLNAPRYGNNDPYADGLAKSIDLAALEFTHKYSRTIGASLDLRYVPVTSHVPFGKVVGATANGRKAGTALSDGSSASHGADTKGPTAVLMSNANSKNLGYKERAARLLNIKLSPACVQGEAGTDKITAFIRSWCDLKLWHLQFNIINKETLLAAQKDPDKYRNLLVRVAGYSAYFIDLSPDLQNDVIARTEHSL
ncbi:MAG TPA: pyruvate formate lyase family protein [Methylomusa anaerophila]|uniref:Benzylsuccinate synthase alpha subunit n=1 Tax=Methylomusa anaerophila TaxID=1930071 RepID=A0A348AJ87_9FIRM|nr:pyruvate formate lyase family protein [Methylomusa anaerophila]BBB91135.1 benzylsuccinate synthase alpha subunit [Methylomusa anaerophila]HML89011.1 pyruvate formate lyase family protein [Methylomusa anaerophila]